MLGSEAKDPKAKQAIKGTAGSIRFVSALKNYHKCHKQIQTGGNLNMSAENIEFKMRCKKRKTQRILNLNIDQGTHIKENLTTIFVNSHCSKNFFHQKFQALSACRALNARILFFQKISIVTNSPR